ncbi:DUF4198 domain-containing protein [Desulfofundulus thermosubterraneus]|uniref:Uncharacterized conserved protein, contains GH25 family domain n=1 Tax=Desulfofundulus thermosubterraneus DSM 16057 TaxID=1121432 RepID=A0A1M6JTJ9_9FIRM|nr:DUF4198 domain-containing protein [Desulfofundulus thermosubterraneus]SHJ50001.1 Uncharacterized conserved protein, contains GH25 family domain [Desulfofundulus thermosubterraneus DSM 16057]
MLKVVQGHEIWVLPEVSHAHEGSEARCRIFYGHAMRPDGLADLGHLSAWAVAPGGERLPLKVESGDDRFHLVTFTPDRDGFWPVTVENDVGPIAITRDGFYRRGTREDHPDAREVGYYYQYARTYVQVGHFCASCGGVVHPPEIVHLGHDLELIVAPGAYRVGDEVILEVRYRGRPLAGAIVKATWSLREEEDWALAQKTDDAGWVKFTLSHPGHWLFYTRYADETRKSEGEYDKRVYSATLSLFGVR